MAWTVTAILLLSLATVNMTVAQMYPQLPHYLNVHYPVNPYQQPVAVHPVAVQPMVVPVVYNHNITNSTFQIKGHDFALGAPSPREKILLHTTVYKKVSTEWLLKKKKKKVCSGNFGVLVTWSGASIRGIL